MSATDNTNVWITESRELILRFPDLLKMLLTDHTSGGNIIWGTDQYSALGKGFQKEDQITEKCLNDTNFSLIQPRVYKSLQNQSERTKALAEVFTAPWICNFMVNQIDYEYFGLKSLFNKSKKDNKNWAGTSKRIPFPTSGGQTWKDYVLSRRLEITCGEAPFLVSRYDVVNDGGSIPTTERIGILDRKLRVVTENAKDEKEWFEFASAAIQSCYGYEYQGDNVFVARVNILLTFSDFLEYAWKRKPTLDELKSIADIVSWNIWQMDGFSYTVPLHKANVESQGSLFSLAEDDQSKNILKECQIKDWQQDITLKFHSLSEIKWLRKKEEQHMKFDYIIGNPPYQDESVGNQENFAKPIYNYFLEQAYQCCEKVELIHPARFLFNAGSTPKAWNEKMLNDTHLKVLYYEPNSAKCFPHTNIMGGIVVTYHDTSKAFRPIRIFTAFPELNGVYTKVSAAANFESLSSIVFTQNKFNLDQLYKDHEDFKTIIGSEGKDKRFRNNIFEKINIFTEEKKSKDDIAVYGIIKNKRVWRYINSRYVDFDHENIKKWKVFVPRANGSDSIGQSEATQLIGEPIIAGPLIGHTQSFISIGVLNNQSEANSLMKYIKSKFARVLLGIRKVTQDNDREAWSLIPKQDFTSSSDIDWSKSIHEIDLQLYKKYGLDDKETAFIETKVREMK
jgi:type II restriction enzyme